MNENSASTFGLNKRKRDNTTEATLQLQPAVQAANTNTSSREAKKQANNMNAKTFLTEGLGLQDDEDIEFVYQKSRKIFNIVQKIQDKQRREQPYLVQSIFFNNLKVYIEHWNKRCENMVNETFAATCYDLLREEALEIYKSVNAIRMVCISYHIREHHLSHLYDLKQLSARIDQLFEWFDNKNNNNLNNNLMEKYTAPYFPIVQSSGMGKTQLMFTYRSLFETPCKLNKISGNIENENSLGIKEKQGKDVACALILSNQLGDLQSRAKGGILFDYFFPMFEIYFDETKASAVAKKIFKFMNNLVKDIRKNNSNADKIVLLFDEAQILLTRKLQETALSLRCIRLWLKMKKEVKVVAVFAGTTLKLTHYFGNDKQLSVFNSFRWLPNHYFYESGESVFPPFICFTTVGSVARMTKDSTLMSSPASLSSDAPLTEYRAAVPHGRPLFAMMDRHDDLESRLDTVLRRLIIRNFDIWWEKDERAWLSVLGTRVQMGQTSTEISTTLISRGYANISGFRNGVPKICFFPDPVCAHLAMCLMNDGAILDVDTQRDVAIVGKSRTWWVDKLKRLFQRGTVRPEKGDGREVFVALYLLFCADELRLVGFSRTMRFSVSVDDWIDRLACRGGKADENVSTKAHAAVTQEADGQACVTVSFIQFCRNYIRSYRKSWESFKSQRFLEYVFTSGTAYYVDGGCPLIDAFASIRITGSSDESSQPIFEYAPLFISIEVDKYISSESARRCCNNMIEKAKDSGLQRALCLLIVFGSDPKIIDDKDLQLPGTVGVASQLVSTIETTNTNLVARVLRISGDDRFGLSQAFVGKTSESEEISEIHASHFLYPAHNTEALEAQHALRKPSGRPAKSVPVEMFQEMVTDMKREISEDDTVET